MTSFRSLVVAASLLATASFAAETAAPAVSPLEQAQTALAAQSTELAAARVAVERSRQALAAAQAEVARLTTERDELVRRLEEAAPGPRGDDATRQDLLARAERELQAARSQVADAEKRQAELARENEGLRAQNTALDRLREELAMTRRQLTSAIADRDALQRKAVDTTAQPAVPGLSDAAAADLRRQLATTESRLEAAVADLGSLRSQLDAANATAASAVAARDALQQQLAIVRADETAASGQAAQLAAAQAEIERLQRTLTDTTRFSEDLARKLEASEAALAVRTAELAQARTVPLAEPTPAVPAPASRDDAELETLRAQLTSAQEHIQQLTTDLDRARLELAGAPRNRGASATVAGRPAATPESQGDVPLATPASAARNSELGTPEAGPAPSPTPVTTPSEDLSPSKGLSLSGSSPQSGGLSPSGSPSRSKEGLSPSGSPLPPSDSQGLSLSGARGPQGLSLSGTGAGVRRSPLRPGTPAALAVSRQASNPTAVSLPAPAVAGPRRHTVVPGDTLSRIALKYYGDADRWAEILDANRAILPDERHLHVGRTLRIPELAK